MIRRNSSSWLLTAWYLAAVVSKFAEDLLRGSFLAVELMRGGAMPRDAITEVLDRIASRTDLQPEHQLAVIALRPDGHWGSGALRPGFRLAASDAGGHQLLEPEIIRLPGT